MLTGAEAGNRPGLGRPTRRGGGIRTRRRQTADRAQVPASSTISPRSGSIRGDSMVDSSRLDGCQQTLDVKRVRPQTTRRQSVTETRSNGFDSLPPGVRHSSAAAAGRCVRCTSGRTTSAALSRRFTCQSIGVSARFSSVIGEHQQRRIRYTSFRPVPSAFYRSCCCWRRR